MEVTARLRAATLAGCLLAALGPAAGADDAPAVDPARAIAVLVKHCAACHGGKGAKAGLSIADRKALVERQLVHPGKPDASELLLLVESGQMPPGTRPKPDEAERRLLRDWIKSRMPEPPPPPPKYGEEYLLGAIATDWKALPEAKQPKVRYLSLNHLLATDAGRKRLAKARAELTRVLGALAGPGAPGLDLKPLDEAASVFRLDLVSLGWDAQPFSTVDSGGENKKVTPATLDLFDLVLLEYPYGVLSLKNKRWPGVVPMLRATKPVRPLPYVRGDWLAAAVTDPVLGKELLALLGKADGPVPAVPSPEVWPASLDLDEFMVELGWEGDREGLGKAVAATGLRETGGVRRADWDRYWPAVIRRLERGVPVLPLDQARRDPYTSDPPFVVKGQTIDFKTKKPKAKFYGDDPKAKPYGGDRMALEVQVPQDATIEATVLDQHGDYLTPPYCPPQPWKGGTPFYEDNKDTKKGPLGYDFDDTRAREAWVVVVVSREGGEVKLAPGEELVAGEHRKAVRTRLLHRTLYELDEAGGSLKEPIDRAARLLVPFETLGTRPKKK
ncbi:MAG: c-type cytochrome domain-containing protein [Gemmataceae bacterium]